MVEKIFVDVYSGEYYLDGCLLGILTTMPQDLMAICRV